MFFLHSLHIIILDFFSHFLSLSLFPCPCLYSPFPSLPFDLSLSAIVVYLVTVSCHLNCHCFCHHPCHCQCHGSMPISKLSFPDFTTILFRRRRSEFWLAGNDIEDEGVWEWAKTRYPIYNIFSDSLHSFSVSPL